ncbi:hypothetical protein ER308_15480 [Egibacter rhizosphaerae]|uniref:Rhamnosyl transferase n=1 Tax=Egibacter rhizosphaerae TaxID=1670831 RepID=A0A411YID3_9ACTN|nr:glycosyltransferase [Egibacter rhizosphaerae]QBI20832.1 hypothetical protein ER308_15480 [Egibacter rhizosphaerae]
MLKSANPMGHADPYVNVVVRYSVFNDEKRGWGGASHDPDIDTYRRRLFNPERLDQHGHLFENVTLPSIAGQDIGVESSWFRLTVLTSTELPPVHKDRLLRAVTPYDWVEVVEVAPDESHKKTLAACVEANGVTGVYVTARVDDDDGIARQWARYLLEHVDENTVGMAVSFPSGVCGILDQDGQTYERCHHSQWFNSSVGQAYISRASKAARNNHVLTLGPHLRVDERVPTITEPRIVAWIRSIHWAQEQSHLGRLDRNVRKVDEGDAMSAGEVRDLFSLTIDL